MHGTVTFYGPDIDSGKITASSGDHYSFRRSDWSYSHQEPRHGMAVVFETREQPSVFKRALRVAPAHDKFAMA